MTDSSNAVMQARMRRKYIPGKSIGSRTRLGSSALRGVADAYAIKPLDSADLLPADFVLPQGHSSTIMPPITLVTISKDSPPFQLS